MDKHQSRGGQGWMLRGREGRGVVAASGRGMPAPLWESSRVEGLKECASWVELHWALRVDAEGQKGRGAG